MTVFIVGIYTCKQSRPTLLKTLTIIELRSMHIFADHKEMLYRCSNEYAVI